MRLLILPGNNALSHIAKGLAVRDALLARGHEAELAVSVEHSPFLASLGIPHHILSDLQQSDHGPAPAFAWFRCPEFFHQVVREEQALMARVRPDRILGIFRFTSATSAALAGLPFDALACGCMLPQFPGVLGFGEAEPGMEEQRGLFNDFYRHCAAKVSKALDAVGRPPIHDVRELLLGEHTFLWDTPGFQPLATTTRIQHVGPLTWRGWPTDPSDMETSRLPSPLAILSFGTAIPPESAPSRLLERLLTLGFHVAIAGGGHFPTWTHPSVTRYRFAPMAALLKRAQLLVCHGGQQTVFEALRRGVPVAVLPFHPEQAQNGLCLERLGAGARLVPPTVFWGSSHVYTEALARISNAELDARLLGLARQRVQAPDPHLNQAAGVLANALGA